MQQERDARQIGQQLAAALAEPAVQVIQNPPVAQGHQQGGPQAGKPSLSHTELTSVVRAVPGKLLIGMLIVEHKWNANKIPNNWSF